MSRRVYKYPIPVRESFELKMPCGATVRTVQIQDGVPFFWATVDDERAEETRTFGVFGTGARLPSPIDAYYVGTFQLAGGSFVGHLFELGSTTLCTPGPQGSST